MAYKDNIKELLMENDINLSKRNKNKVAIAIVDLIKDEFINFNLDDEYDYEYILKGFDVLIECLKDSETMLNILYEDFISIHNNIRVILHSNKNKNLNDFEKEKIGWLHKIINKMENTMLCISYNSPIAYDPSKEEYINFIIFKLKNINFVRQACEKFPYLVNSLNKNELPLIEVVLNQLLTSLEDYISKPNLGPLNDLIYYQKVFTTILESEKFKLNDVEKEVLLNKLNKFKMIQSHRNISQIAKEKMSYHTNLVILQLKGKKTNPKIQDLNYKYEVHDNFKECHKLEADQIILSQDKSLEQAKTNPIYTYDGEDACEIDDGLSISLDDGIYHLGVHIADPTAYIPQYSILDEEAKRRTRSLYMGEDSISMYPPNLSSGIMGLNEGKVSYAMSYYYDIDARTGELINSTVKAEPIIITKNTTYNEFDRILHEGTSDKNLQENILLLSQVSTLLKRFYNEDAIYHELHNLRDKSTSRGVIESAMIYTNYQNAKWFDEHGLPFIYRCHEVNEEEIEMLTKIQEGLKASKKTDQMIRDLEMIKNIFPKAYYTTKNVGHYGLGIPYYSHDTSPLRRYPDNSNIRCIKKFRLNEYSKDDIKKWFEIAQKDAEESNQKRTALDNYEIEYSYIKSLNK